MRQLQSVVEDGESDQEMAIEALNVLCALNTSTRVGERLFYTGRCTLVFKSATMELINLLLERRGGYP